MKLMFDMVFKILSSLKHCRDVARNVSTEIFCNSSNFGTIFAERERERERERESLQYKLVCRFGMFRVRHAQGTELYYDLKTFKDIEI